MQPHEQLAPQTHCQSEEETCYLPPLLGFQGLVYGTREKADLFVDTLEDSFQENITPYDDDHIDKVDRTVRRFLRNNIPNYPPLTSPQEICEIIKKLKNKKAPGQDQIRNIALKSLPINAITHLTKIINRCVVYLTVTSERLNCD
ncbi:RNA-directed DNA polymerase from mobile element jockey [Trichonephila clavipes]|nr:RNA-directed DNA polymerase from mobile element jockey [Trichonephila clavipes]